MRQVGAEERIGEDAERGTLDVSRRPVEGNGGDGDDADAERPQRHEESVPMIERGEIRRQDADDDHGAHERFAEQSRRAVVFA